MGTIVRTKKFVDGIFDVKVFFPFRKEEKRVFKGTCRIYFDYPYKHFPRPRPGKKVYGRILDRSTALQMYNWGDNIWIMRQNAITLYATRWFGSVG